MSWIDKLGILGIRSFSPEDPVYVQFNSPCTVIYGANGTGKTTIIECLKYACTGTSEVRSQIRLQFYNVNGHKMICTRSMSLTQRKSTVSQKTLDTSLRQFDPVTGEMTSISTRCSDMDNDLPNHLGVPKAILENVIFCHQEESNWPLSEPSVLKKKFDDIFASTKYTKALAKIKDDRKEKAADIRVDKVQVTTLKSDVDKAQKIQRSLGELRNRTDAKREEAKQLDGELDETTQQINSLLEKFRQAEKVSNEISQLKHRKSTLQETIDEIGKNIQDRQETDEELKTLLAALSSEVEKDEEIRRDNEYECLRIEQHIQSTRDAIASKLTSIGRLQAASEAVEKLIKERQQILQVANEELSLGLSSFDEHSVQAIKDLVTSREVNLQRIKVYLLSYRLALVFLKEKETLPSRMTHARARWISPNGCKCLLPNVQLWKKPKSWPNAR
ncbi:AAA domain-containing protein [Dichotomocladium elegans]|nr:AAA domain-containing protein [Dichotomocladium elegans]